MQITLEDIFNRLNKEDLKMLVALREKAGMPQFATTKDELVRSSALSHYKGGVAITRLEAIGAVARGSGGKMYLTEIGKELLALAERRG